MSATERKTAEEGLKRPDTEERLVLATGRYLGEGFDDASLDTLEFELRRLPGVLSVAVRDEGDRDADGASDATGVGSPIVRLAIGLRDDGALGGVISLLAEQGSHLREISKSEPTLEEVFVQLVGRGLGESEPVASAR